MDHEYVHLFLTFRCLVLGLTRQPQVCGTGWRVVALTRLKKLLVEVLGRRRSHRPGFVRHCYGGSAHENVTCVVRITNARASAGDVTVNDDLLASSFEENRPRLRAIAYRILGSPTEADDALQEAWLRLRRADADRIDNLAGWLTTVVGHVCLDALRSRTMRHELPLDESAVKPVAQAHATDPEQQALLADSVGQALLVVLETLTPTERLAFVLHDMFAVSFDDIAPIVGRSPVAARQLASRARRRVQADGTTPEVDLSRQRRIVDAFFAASRDGKFEDLLTLLDPDVVMRADAAAAQMGSSSQTRGSAAVAEFFSGRAGGVLLAIIDGAAGGVVVASGQTRIAISFTIANDRIIAIEAVAEPEQLTELDIAILNGRT
jgi:RNA polymerase sigma-70 factor (ECF subfamily)